MLRIQRKMETMTPISSPTRDSYAESLIEEIIESAESIITKWDLNSTSITKVTTLFSYSRKEAKEYIKNVNDLRRAMHLLVTRNSTSPSLILAQSLMVIAIKRLEKEFYQILSAYRHQLEPDSVSGQSSNGSSTIDDDNDDDDGEVGSEQELKLAGKTITKVEKDSARSMYDLKLIADCMINSGHGLECVTIYKLLRKSIVDEGLSQLGINRYRSSSINKMNLDALNHVSKHWMYAVKIAVKTLFYGERSLCDYVFSASNSIRKSCFYDITKEGAINLLRLPQLIAKKKRLPEAIFQQLELYEVLSDLWPEIESIFIFDTASPVKEQALSSLHSLGESVRKILLEFELSVQNDSSKIPVPGGGIHPLNRKIMPYLSSLANYSGVLSEIFSSHPPSKFGKLPESYFQSPKFNDDSTSIVSIYLARVILVLLCKLDSKAKLYKDTSLAYLYLANNLQFIIEQVHSSHLLYDLLGDDWVFNIAKKVKQYTMNHESLAWTKVISALPDKDSQEISPEEAKECFRRFNAAFEEAYRKQTSWVVPDKKMRDQLIVSVANKLVPAYRDFYETYLPLLSWEKNLEVLVRIGPDDLGNYLSDLFHGTSSSSCSSKSSLWNSRGCISI